MPELEEEYKLLTQKEEQTMRTLVSINVDYPGTVTEESVEDVIERLHKRKNHIMY